MKQIARSRLHALLEELSAMEPVYLPAENAPGKTAFRLWEPGVEPVLEGNTVRSAKDLFFPQVEELVRFRVQGKKVEILESQAQRRPFVIFGVRGCDCRSFQLLDRVFLGEPQDTFYAARREDGLVITLACTRPEETCFCTAFSIDPTSPGGDITCYLEGETLYWQANTDRGQALTDRLTTLEEAGEAAQEAVEAQRQRTAQILEKLPFGKLDLTGFDGAHMMELFDSPHWAKLSESCLGCGSCTFSCPTCQCYDVEDFDNGREVCRFRCWDSCMYSDFTMMAHGTNRPTQLERFRQRFLHKLVYFPSNNQGLYSCVGCGRCLRQCPIHMNIVKVAKTLKEDLS